MEEYYMIKLIFFKSRKEAQEFTSIVGGAIAIGGATAFFEENFGECDSRKTLVVGRFAEHEMKSYEHDFGIKKFKKYGRTYYEKV
jgi:hypothetical protein